VVRVNASKVSGWFDRRCIATAAAILFLAGLAGCSAQSSPAAAWSPTPTVSAPALAPRGATIAPHMEVASWYGPGFQGRTTSSGERFNQNDLTAASTTLPLGSRVRVTNPANGRSVEVRINDRGPYVPGRTIDLSRGAAERIGLARAGVGPVEVASPIAAPTPGGMMPLAYAAPARTASWPQRRSFERRVALWSLQHPVERHRYGARRRWKRPRIVANPIADAIADTFRMF
jgi:hypothetical protein